MPQATPNSFEWPVVLETTSHALVGSRVFEPYLDQRRTDNTASWSDKRHWMLGFYFGKNDTRLWVPRRLKNGGAKDDDRVINFGHPLGRKAFRILMLGYMIGFAALTMVVAALAGIRW